MSAAPPSGGTEAAPVQQRTRTFRKAGIKSRLSPDQVRRQNDVLQSAWRHFKAPGPAIAFLNTENAQLRGQPLHIALDSDEGLIRVERLLGELTYKG